MAMPYRPKANVSSKRPALQIKESLDVLRAHSTRVIVVQGKYFHCLLAMDHELAKPQKAIFVLKEKFEWQ